jgi:hypothetical protein
MILQGMELNYDSMSHVDDLMIRKTNIRRAVTNVRRAV